MFATLFVFGTALRIMSLFYMGVSDMPEYVRWGTCAYEEGLAKAYHGIYFPLQYQIFQLCVALSDWSGLEPYMILKGVNLTFDFGILFVLIRLLRAWKLRASYALLYWCHPWFLAITFLGYIDVQYSFFILSTVYLARKERSFRGAFIAGIPLGLAFLMKPQAEILVLACGLYFVSQWLYHREWRSLGFLIMPSLFFIAYSVFFFVQVGDITRVTSSYLAVASAYPCLTASMLNIWYPLAYFFVPTGFHLYPDTNLIVGLISYRTVGIILTFMALTTFIVKIGKAPQALEGDRRTYVLFTCAAMVLPMLMTCAHENHFYLSCILLVILLPLVPSLFYAAGIHYLLLLQAFNILSLYGLGRNALSKYVWMVFDNLRTPTFTLIATIIGCMCFFSLYNLLFELVSAPQRRIRRFVPGLILFATVLAIEVICVAI